MDWHIVKKEFSQVMSLWKDELTKSAFIFIYFGLFTYIRSHI